MSWLRRSQERGEGGIQASDAFSGLDHLIHGDGQALGPLPGWNS